ncbi:GNAT family N-acetyltransferase [Niveispirillum sp. BGYR6]|uniref:GNAT family N-acetyltransferase n=1 Tax=Niveispirillum sp. BGYR6 TaxID=2971249 RepID=UPI0022B9C28B|nr:GNAT family N-acetyltransferase [Niveispirillum sp. BGYR6]MDG5493625.1 GNAT family N-acetyltransferase [Niveispirillum sp. BGYR6]
MVEIRRATIEDANGIVCLLEQLGYRLDETQVASRITQLESTGTDPILVAVSEGRYLGVIALNWVLMLHAPTLIARITTLVVHEQARGLGVGRKLVDAAAALARAAGCDTLEVTTALRRADAQAFYKSLGFTHSSARLHMPM